MGLDYNSFLIYNNFIQINIWNIYNKKLRAKQFLISRYLSSQLRYFYLLLFYHIMIYLTIKNILYNQSSILFFYFHSPLSYFLYWQSCENLSFSLNEGLEGSLVILLRFNRRIFWRFPVISGNRSQVLNFFLLPCPQNRFSASFKSSPAVKLCII